MGELPRLWRSTRLSSRRPAQRLRTAAIPRRSRLQLQFWLQRLLLLPLQFWLPLLLPPPLRHSPPPWLLHTQGLRGRGSLSKSRSIYTLSMPNSHRSAPTNRKAASCRTGALTAKLRRWGRRCVLSRARMAYAAARSAIRRATSSANSNKTYSVHGCSMATRTARALIPTCTSGRRQLNRCSFRVRGACAVRTCCTTQSRGDMYTHEVVLLASVQMRWWPSMALSQAFVRWSSHSRSIQSCLAGVQGTVLQRVAPWQRA